MFQMVHCVVVVQMAHSSRSDPVHLPESVLIQQSHLESCAEYPPHFRLAGQPVCLGRRMDAGVRDRGWRVGQLLMLS